MNQIKSTGAFTLLAVACLTIMVGCVIVPGLTAVAENLGTPSAASWLVTVPSLGVVIFGPLAGRFIDRVGAYRALLWGLFCYGLSGSGGVLLHGTLPVMIDRLLLGGATAVVMAAGTVLISLFYSGQARMKMIASQGMSIELGGVISLFIGGLLASLGWRWPFLLYLIAWLLLAMQLMFVPRPSAEPEEEKIGNEIRDLSPAIGQLKTVLFAALASMLCFFTGVIVIPQQFHQLNIGAAETGYFLSFVSLIAVFAAAIMPKMVKRLGEFGTLYAAFACYAAAHLIFSASSGVVPFIAGGVLMGCGFGLSVPLVNHMTVELSEAHVRGRNLAWLSMAIFSGQFLSSFMEFIPGNASVIFAGAALIGIAVMVMLYLLRRGMRED
ncbi:MFS transporter [Pantoea coffeiphila]|uniref:MFS transporter n=1 Tax=Pantoea coffeiphila TaxID=1465635 RepID=A0A2S9I9G3_9GAMM|nr:MFS transporter [Pantoea coffeiphila]PRD14428.1 MFS transporter [Pantoea coffeiphila]